MWLGFKIILADFLEAFISLVLQLYLAKKNFTQTSLFQPFFPLLSWR